MNSENFKIVAVTRNVVSIEILDPSKFDGEFNIGSFVKIPYDEGSENHIVGVIENYKIKSNDSNDPTAEHAPATFIIEVRLVGTFSKTSPSADFMFNRGAQGIPLPPNNGISLFTDADFHNLYSSGLDESEKFQFSSLVENESIRVSVNGNKFFNKHFAIVGSTGSGKSHTVAKVIQQAVKDKNAGFKGLNNSHVILFDIHGEYRKAFPDSNHIDQSNIKIPYWLFDSEELADLFIESSEENSHNQVSIFKTAVTENKRRHNPGANPDKVFFDSPLKFEIKEVINYIKNLNNEIIGRCAGENLPKLSDGTLIDNRSDHYFEKVVEFCEPSAAKADRATSGPYKGDFERFVLRLENSVNNPRLNFIFDPLSKVELPEVLRQLLGYEDKPCNVTVIDLSGIPFEVLSITVSLITRLLFDYGYYQKKILDEDVDSETPLLLVFEEAHKYVPKSNLAKYRASKNAIERIAKEGRKYGVTLGIVSQRPSEISETIFSQCNNFIAMRLSNPEDQNYVRRLLPDALGDLTNSLPTLQSGEAILMGEAVILPSLVSVDFPDSEPESTDIRYYELWKEQWKDVDFEKLAKRSKGEDI